VAFILLKKRDGPLYLFPDGDLAMPIRRRLELEELCERIVPSGTPLFGVTAQAEFAQVAQQQHALAGQGHGTYTSPFSIPDTGVQYDLQGVAHLAKLGDVTVTGSVHSLGFIVSGKASGTLTFTNANGSVTVELQGPVQPGFASLPHTFHYKVVSGTGAYQNLHDSGSLHLVLKPAQAGAAAGTFKLTI
jgi:hypothetical protein